MGKKAKFDANVRVLFVRFGPILAHSFRPILGTFGFYTSNVKFFLENKEKLLLTLYKKKIKESRLQSQIH